MHLSSIVSLWLIYWTSTTIHKLVGTDAVESTTIVPTTDTDYSTKLPSLDVPNLLQKFVIKFYKGRYNEGQNIAMAPLLLFYTLMALYDIVDESSRVDLHTLAEIPQDLSAETMLALERAADFYLRKAASDRSRIKGRLYYDRSVGPLNRGLMTKNFTTAGTNFRAKEKFLHSVNMWIKSDRFRSTDDLVDASYVQDDTKAFLVGGFSFQWPTQLKRSAKQRTFQNEQTFFLEGNIRTLYANIPELKLEVLELKRQELKRMKVWLILPGQQYSIKNFSNSLAVDTIAKIEQSLRPTVVDVSIPQISIEYNSQEDWHVRAAFQVFTSLFTADSVKLTEGQENRYPIKNFLLKCIFKLEEATGDDEPSAQTSGNTPEQKLTFDRPFVVMVLAKRDNMPLMMANYFSTTDKLRQLEQLEKKLRDEENAKRRNDL